jgi:hypothetical protein
MLLTCLNVIAFLLLIPALVMAFFSPLMYTAPDANKRTDIKMLRLWVLSLPLVMGLIALGLPLLRYLQVDVLVLVCAFIWIPHAIVISYLLLTSDYFR